LARASLPSESQPIVEEQDNCGDLGGWCKKVRAHRRDKIQAQCGTIRLLDVPNWLSDIYVSVNILEALLSQNWIDVSNIQAFSKKSLTGLTGSTRNDSQH